MQSDHDGTRAITSSAMEVSAESRSMALPAFIVKPNFHHASPLTYSAALTAAATASFILSLTFLGPVARTGNEYVAPRSDSGSVETIRSFEKTVLRGGYTQLGGELLSIGGGSLFAYQQHRHIDGKP